MTRKKKKKISDIKVGATEQIASKHGKTSIGIDLAVESIPTGINGLNNILGKSGFVLGHVVELYGNEGGGKTTLALNTLREAQKKYPKKKVAFIDAEHAMNPDYVRGLGIDLSPERFTYVNPTTGEMVFDTINIMAESAEYSLIVVDSITSLLPQAIEDMEYDGANMKTNVALAILMSGSMRKTVPRLESSKTTLICINQLRLKPGVLYGNPEYRPGGKSLAFYACQIVKVQASGSIKVVPSDKQSAEIGKEVCMTIMKDKFFNPDEQDKDRKYRLEIYYGRGFVEKENK